MPLCRTNHCYRTHAPAATLLSLLLLGSLPTHVPVAEAQQVETQQIREYNIASGSLGEVLSRFAAEAGILLSGDAALTGQQTSPGLQGRYNVRQALDTLLAGTNVTYRFTGPDTVTLERVVVQENGPVQLEAITVTGIADNFGQLPTSTANVGDTTTATRFPIESREIPRSVGVVSEQLIEETAARNPGELSAYVSGVSRENDIARAGNFFIRGFPVGTRATIDGFRNPRGFGSSGTFIVTDLALYERVEFLKGASAILYGQGEPGGNVNYVSKKPLFERAHSVEAGLSRDDYFRGVFDTTGPLGEDLAYRLIGVAQNSNWFTPAIKDDRLIINPSILWNTPTGGELYVNYEYNHTNRIGNFFHNAVLINGVVVPYQIHDPTRDFDEQFRTHNLHAQFKQPLTDAWTLALDAAYSEQDHLQRRVTFLPDSAVNPTQSEGFAFSQDRTDEAWGFRGELRGDFELGFTRHRLAVGYERYEFEQPGLRTLSSAFAPGPVFDQQFGVPLPPPLDPPISFFFEREEQGVYLIDHVDIGERVHLLGGLRYASFEDINTFAGNRSVLSDESGLSPSLGAVYDLIPQLSVYASWSQSFDSNFGMDVDGNLFDPSEGEQFEIGLKGDVFNERLFYTLAVFDLTQTDVTTTDPNNPDFSALLGEVNIRGVELDLSAQITDRLSSILALTYHDSEVTENNDGREGEELANTPNFAGTLRLSYLATDYLRLGGNVIYVGERQGADFGIPFEVDDYWRVDLDASLRISQLPGLTLSAAVENLLDDDYVAGSRSPTQIQLGRPQTFTLRAKYEF